MLLSSSRAGPLAERIRQLYLQLMATDPQACSVLLGQLAENPQVDIVQYATDEVWVTKTSERIEIGQMTHQHLAHALACVMRFAKSGQCWGLRGDGALRLYSRWPK